jgi:hypothetical protein
MFRENVNEGKFPLRNFTRNCGHTHPARADFVAANGIHITNMNKNITIKSLILAAAVSLGLSAASAQSANVAVPTPSETASSGLLGSRYTEVSYKFIDLKGDDNANGFQIAYNQPLSAGFDFVASYDWAKADFGGFDAKVQDLEVGVKAFSVLSWGKPYVLAATGWEWQKGGVFNDDSFTYKVGIGAEFQAAPAITVTPFVNFTRATSFNTNAVQYGVKAAYRLNSAWSLTARAQYNDIRHESNDTEYTIGALYRF